MTTKMFLTAVALSCGILTAGCSNDAPVSAGQEDASVSACRRTCKKQIINADPFGKVTLQGYDAVAFHTTGTATRGNPSIVSEYLDYKYLFATEENKALFDADPEQYLPAYGGFCAFGVSLGVLFPIEISTWTIVDGRLILQFSDQFRQIFEENTEENIHKADSVWLEMTTTRPCRH